MLQHFLYAYLKGYQDELHDVHALAAMPAGFNERRMDSISRANLTSRPAYRAGFLEGCKDRVTFV